MIELGLKSRKASRHDLDAAVQPGIGRFQPRKPSFQFQGSGDLIRRFVRMMSAAGEQADESIVDRLFRLTGGNPFFLREAVNLITQSPGSPLAGDRAWT